MNALKYQQVEKIAKALSDPHRLKILEALKVEGTLVCGDLQSLLQLSQPTVSHHVKILVESGVIQSQKEGRCLRLTLDRDALSAFCENLADWLPRN